MTRNSIFCCKWHNYFPTWRQRSKSELPNAGDPFWRQINTWRHKMFKFSPLLIWYAFAIMNPFSWIMIASEKRCPTSVAVWSRPRPQFKLLFPKGVSEFCSPRGRHWVLINDTWHVLLQSENVFELAGITMSFTCSGEPCSAQFILSRVGSILCQHGSCSWLKS